GNRFAPGPRPVNQLEQGLWGHDCPTCQGPTRWLATPETHMSPPNAYAMAKHSQELQALTFGQRYGIPSVAMRYSIVQGPRQSFYNAYSGACRIFSLHYYFGKAPTIYEDGLQCRDFVNISDVVRANLMALTDDRMPGSAFNVGGGRAWTVADFALIVKKEMELRLSRNLPPPEVGGRFRFGDTRHAVSDISRMRALDWGPQHGPEESVRRYADYLFDQDNVQDILDYADRTMKDLDVVRSVKGK
ncbi:MAG: NAD-dependent epimerase/dehydratase family protein, partial [Pseudomonadota bacterium]